MTDEDTVKEEPMAMVEGLTVEYDGERAVDGVTFDVREGEIFCLLGPSGCGKTTTLKAIAGLEDPDEGDVYIEGERVTDQPPYSRDTSVVFQEWALFQRKTVSENVGFAMRMEGVNSDARTERVESILEDVSLSEKEDAYPDELSGGQKQRVALARSLAADPSVLLLDEPLSNLDEGLRREMRLELLRLQSDFEKTSVHVTHDQEEAFTLGDRVGVMRDGRLVQVGKPSEVYSDPDTRFVEEFLGETTFVRGRLSGGRTVDTLVGELEVSGAKGPTCAEESKEVEVSLRPEEVDLSYPASTDGGSAAEGVLGDISGRVNRGSTVRYHVNVEGLDEPLVAEYGAREDPGFKDGDRVSVSVSEKPPAFDDGGGRVV